MSSRVLIRKIAINTRDAKLVENARVTGLAESPSCFDASFLSFYRTVRLD